MNSGASPSLNIPWGLLIIGAAGGVLFLGGAGRFVLRHCFGFMDALNCGLALIPAGILLFLIAYVVQHAKVAAIVPLALAGVLIYSSPIFDVALGLALLGVVADTVQSDRKYDEYLRKSASSSR